MAAFPAISKVSEQKQQKEKEGKVMGNINLNAQRKESMFSSNISH
jgi:hypothetical protein